MSSGIELWRSDYSGVTRKLKLDKGMWPNGLLSPRGIVCTLSAHDPIRQRSGLPTFRGRLGSS
jgi:hypothetical protein